MILMRRSLIALALLAPVAAFAAGFDTVKPATPADVQAAQARGEAVFVDFKASWCSTCRAQEKVIGALLEEDPSLAQKITFLSLDWDQFADDPFTTGLNVPRRSTLIAFKGDTEQGRIIAGTDRDEIKALIHSLLP
ncbi:thioredoxin family protein [Gemmobacter caeruleus]|uniref:thioredoxin family protein n=1 Tax=Gemmobacter caeruleus TaxID=2595004 RepID=UPI0011EE9C40|nr:thioredoxin family protein [Gemmobacter caeruleus]